MTKRKTERQTERASGVQRAETILRANISPLYDSDDGATKGGAEGEFHATLALNRSLMSDC